MEKGFTRAEVLAVLVVMGTLGALVVALKPQPPAPPPRIEVPEVRPAAPRAPEPRPEPPPPLPPVARAPGPAEPAPDEEAPRADPMRFRANKVECLNHVRSLTALLEVTGSAYPPHGGPELLVYLVKKGELRAEERWLGYLFCPGDGRENLANAGGPAAYSALDLNQGLHGHLTSYAGRDLNDHTCATGRGASESVVLLCDDSEDHHDGLGVVVGLSGGAAKWRDKVRDYALGPDDALEIGPRSAVKELQCLRGE